MFLGVGNSVCRSQCAEASPLTLLPGVVSAWWTPEYGVYQETTGASATTPATADSDPVGTWAGRSSAGSLVYQVAGAAGQRPLNKTAIVNSRAVLRFDGVDDRVLTGAVVSAAGDLSVMCVLHAATNSAGRRVMAWDTGSAIGLQVVLSATGQIGIDNSGGPSSSVNSAGGKADGVAHCAIVTRSGTTYTLYLDGSSIGTSGGTAPAYDVMRTGSYESGATLYDRDVCEIVASAGTVWNASQIAALTSYCRTKWGSP